MLCARPRVSPFVCVASVRGEWKQQNWSDRGGPSGLFGGESAGGGERGTQRAGAAPFKLAMAMADWIGGPAIGHGGIAVLSRMTEGPKLCGGHEAAYGRRAGVLRGVLGEVAGGTSRLTWL